MGESRLRVVVVDNDPDALDLAVTDLSFEGHDIVGQARDGAAAIDLCRRLRPDVLVVDHRMPPGPHGLEVAQALLPSDELRVIVYTNYQDPALIEAIKRSGAVYLPKGSLRALRRAVRGDAEGPAA